MANFRSSRAPLAAPLLALLLLAEAAPAQILNYPIDPADQAGSNLPRTSSQTGRGTTAQAGSDAARTQVGTGTIDPPGRYEPDRIEPLRDVDDRTTSDRERDLSRDRALDRANQREDVAPLVQSAPPPNEFERYVSDLVDKRLRRFGSNLLVPGSREFTAPPSTAVPPDYRLNVGDEILVGLSGSVDATNLRLVVDPEGKVFIPRVGSVTVGGSRYGDLQSLIARAVSRQYRSFRVAVTIGQLQGITVYVTGFARLPGSYTVNSLSTLVNAVLASGGPSAGGSFRSIQVRRNGRLISDFDLYDLLLKGDRSADVLLQNGDVIYIAPAGPQVAVVGSVNVEAIYEARTGETLQDLLLYAGGVNTVADNTRLLLLNPTQPQGWRELTPGQVAQQVAERASILRVLPAIGIAQPQLRQPALVTVSGEVARPGRYYVQPGTSVGAVIAQAGGLTPQAYVFGTVFTRESVKQTQRNSYRRAVDDLELLLKSQPLTSVDQAAALNAARLQAVQSIVEQLQQREPDGRLIMAVSTADSQLPGDLILENNDALYIPPQPVTVGVFGAVPSPASFQYRRGETVGQYLARAGGVQKIGDKSQIFVIRANGTLISQRTVNVQRQPVLPGDLVFVPVNANRGEFWARVRDITSALTPAIVTAVAVTQ